MLDFKKFFERPKPAAKEPAENGEAREEEPRKVGVVTLDQEVKASEKAPGLKLEDIFVGETLEIVTQHSTYTLERREDGFYMSGGKYLPALTKVHINGSTWGGSVLKQDFIGGGMCLELVLLDAPPGKNRLLTSFIQEIRIKESGLSKMIQ